MRTQSVQWGLANLQARRLVFQFRQIDRVLVLALAHVDGSLQTQPSNYTNPAMKFAILFANFTWVLDSLLRAHLSGGWSVKKACGEHTGGLASGWVEAGSVGGHGNLPE